MNYLAHAVLSNNNPALLVGNFIADHLRGNNFEGYSPEIIEGIRLHRKIDAFTDAHPLFKESKRVFYNGFEKHSGILVDIYFDHLLAKHFANFHHEGLNNFSAKVYSIYSDHAHLLPGTSNRFLEYVTKNNIYMAYSNLQGIEKVLYHLSQRIRHEIRLDGSVQLFKLNEGKLTENFNAFFSEAREMFLQ